ncbi:hypothetical protein F5Y10DRAFT_273656 [Nemania abortiva]|nr:hypothetical protein F5Y10DRAFT_273656 [Nemania abortiva]
MSTDPGTESRTVARATQTEDDWSEIKADLRKLVEAVQSLVPQPKPTETEREFICDIELWKREIRPTRERLEFHAGLVLLIFNRERREISRLPSFIDKLTLRLSNKKEVSRTYMQLESVGCLWEQLKLGIASPTCPQQTPTGLDLDHPVDERANMWNWNGHGSGLRFFTGQWGDKTRFYPWSVGRDREFMDQNLPPKSPHGYGTICVMSAPIKDGILSFRSINIILALLGRWIHDLNEYQENSLYTAPMIYFLGVFAGQWPVRNERILFSCRGERYAPWGGFRRQYLQLHFRCFESIESLGNSPGTGGLKCDREQGQIPSDTHGMAPYFFEERRISIFGLLSTHGTNTPPFYSIVILSDFELQPDREWNSEGYAGLEGSIAFGGAIIESVRLWQTKWNAVLDDIDERLRVRLDHTLDPGEIDTWMFDKTEFERSKLYVTILQILRIFGECIRTVSDDLCLLDDVFLRDPYFPMDNMRPHEIQIMRSNWELVKEFQKNAEEIILGRILQKTEEVKSLRDGLFNATSLREANLSSREAQRSALMARYVLIFTVVTILYLPPSFISTVLDMDIFKKDTAQAFAAIIAADWKGFKHTCWVWWARLTVREDGHGVNSEIKETV